MKIKYHRQIVDMLYEEWDLGKKKSHAKGKTCAWIYWFEILSDAEQIVIEKDNDKIIGLCAYSKWNSKKHFIRKKYYSILRKILINSPLIRNKKAIYEYSEGYNYLPKEFNGYFDGEMNILIVDRSYRSKKIGTKLLNKIFKLVYKDNMKNIHILSDESCNYKFYEDFGCKKVYEKIIPNNEPYICGDTLFRKGFVYEKRF